MIIDTLHKQGLIHPPHFLASNTHYLTIMGSEAYGVSSGDSDVDLYGFCIPEKAMVFPHLAGEIPGFGKQRQRFEQWQQHHIKSHPKEYDIVVFSIVKYFQLLMDNNPNIVSSIWTPRVCVVHSSPIGEIVRERRQMFLHKGCWPKFKGYAYAQMHKIDIKQNSSNPKRAADIAAHKYDTKFGMHCVRLLAECEQILIEGELDLQRNREQLKAIRRGEWTLEQLKSHFADKERHLAQAYADSKLPPGPNEAAIKQLLLDCLEQHYGSLAGAVARDVSVDQVLREVQEVIDRHQKS